MTANLIGVQFYSTGKNKLVCTVTDIHTTYNSAGDVIKTRYVAEHLFMGQKVLDNDVCIVTIQRNAV